MYERRIYRQRKSGLNAATVLLALAALGLAFLILRPGPDKTQPDRAAVESAAAPASDPVADAPAAVAGADRQELSGLRHQVAKASQDLTALRSATEQMRAELGVLRKQRESLPPAAAASPPVPVSAPAAQPRPVPVAEPPALTAAAPIAETKPRSAVPSAPDSAKPAAAEKTAAASEPQKKLPHHPHNAHGYLLSARDELQSGDPARAAEALERAETWALNNSGDYQDNLSPTEDPLVSTVEGVRAQLRAGRKTSALRMLESLLAVPRSARAEQLDKR